MFANLQRLSTLLYQRIFVFDCALVVTQSNRSEIICVLPLYQTTVPARDSLRLAVFGFRNVWLYSFRGMPSLVRCSRQQNPLCMRRIDGYHPNIMRSEEGVRAALLLMLSVNTF